jgi:hypothetical protein
MPVVVENFVEVVDTAGLAPVDRLAVPAVNTPYLVAAALSVSERSWENCHCQHLQAFHNLDKNSLYRGRVHCNLCKRVWWIVPLYFPFIIG